MFSEIKTSNDNIELKNDNSQTISNDYTNDTQNINEKSIQKKKLIHKKSINCLNKCTTYKLNLTIKQNKTIVGYLFNNNNTYFFPNISSNQLLLLLKKKEETEGFNINNKLNIQKIKINNNSDNEKYLEQKLSFPIQNNNQLKNEISIWDDPSVSLVLNGNEKTSCILIEIDLDNNKEQNKYFKEINKSFINREITCSLNGIVHESELLKNDISFSIDSKSLIKSIESRIDDYKKDYLKLCGNNNKKLFRYRNTFFTPLIRNSNIGILFSTYNKKDLCNLEKLQINFNSITMKKFTLIKMFIAINIPNYLTNQIKISDDIISYSNLSQSSKGIQALSMYSETDIINTFNYLNCQLNASPNLSFTNSSSNNEEIKDFQFLNNSFNQCYNSPFNNKNNFINDKLRKSAISSYNNNYSKKTIYINKSYNSHKNNSINFMDIKNEKNQNYFDENIKIKPIIINKSDKFVNILYKKYKTKSNYLSNFLIFKKLVKISFSNQKLIEYITLGDFFKSFERISSFGLKIPLFQEQGNFLEETYSPSLSSLVLYIKNVELYEIISNKLNTIKQNQNEENLMNNYYNEYIYNDKVKTSLIGQYILLEFNENKPPFLRKSFIEQINNILNSVNNLNNVKINDIELERSYFSISWNPINSFHNQTSFLSYYLFNSTLIGILPIKFDYNIWLAKIGYDNNEILSKRGKELIDSIIKVENYLYNYSFSYSSDYDFYLKNKFLIQNK